MDPSGDFDAQFERLTGHPPFPWQQALFGELLEGRIPKACDIPTGLGKTAVMAIWLLARAHGAALPRRLVYVVDRRAVVDQATDVAEGIRKIVEIDPALKYAIGLKESRSLPISTLRGQYVDNKEWLEDPASPAIIVGTVDMIGSKLLFEGYGTSRKMRPYHAGLIGADALVVLDEAHLVPPFEKLLETIADGELLFGPREESLRELIPPFRLLSLSATGRASSSTSWGLKDADLKHPVVNQRLIAPKWLRRYILGLSLVVATEPPDGFLRQGCLLTPNPSVPAHWEVVQRSGKRDTINLTAELAREYAVGAARSFEVGPSREAMFDRALAKADVTDGGKKKKPAAGKKATS